jgi:LacI family transcriptional regulator
MERETGDLTRRRNGASIYDVAKAAGVSIATVSRALNGGGSVAPAMARRVAEAVDALGYIPARAAQDLSNRRSRMLAAILPSLDYAIHARKVEAFRARAASRGYGLLLATSNWSLETEYEQCIDLIRGGAEGIMLEGGLHRAALYEALQRRGIPYVHTSTYKPQGEHPSIGFDNIEIGARAARHLLDLGHVDIGVIAGRLTDNDRTSERVEGVRQALEARGLALPDNRVIQCEYRIGDARQAFRHLISASPAPTALVCTNDVLALGAVLEGQHAGIAIPDRVSIVGYDDLDWAAHLKPGLTTFYVPTAEIGERSADYLIGRIEKHSVVDHSELEVPFILRSSTGPGPAATAVAGHAIRTDGIRSSRPRREK